MNHLQRHRRRSAARHDRRVLLLAFLAGLPGTAVALALLWTGDFTPRAQWTLTLLLTALWWGFTLGTRERVVRPLQTLANLLAALREGDFSIRAGSVSPDDPLGLALLEVNMLSETLREQRVGALEATALLRTVMEEIDVAIFAFDGEERLRLVNRSGERLLRQAAARLLGRSAQDLGLAVCLRGEPARTLEATFPGGGGRWELRRNMFRQGGRPHELLVLSDLSRALREEERQAWQRLIRVLSHEINNSLAPIQSIAGSLQDILRRDPPPEDWDDDLRQGLAVIAGRSGALSRFMSSYARLARLPPPRREPMDVGEWVRRVAELEPRLPVAVRGGPEMTITADGDQLDQLLINLVRNAVDASLETGGGVEVGWSARNGHLEVWVDDEGPGLANTTNLFVPFFTTKPQGSGIGLALSRQIAEAHGGTLLLENRAAGSGCEARLLLPL
ncbi:MAG TPA: ATP-binding protein [Longimicrobiaceae bacterium]|nr:ATP-binding protein [Longimicrobiaceae bacterium]